MASDPTVTGAPSRLGCALRWLVGLLVLGALAAAALVLYQMWLVGGTSLDRAQVNPNLSATERLYLEYYLSQHAAELEAPAGVGQNPISFAVNPGEGAGAIAETLVAAGLLRDRELFLNYLAYYGLDGTLGAGTYTLRPDLTVPQLAEALSSGRGRTLELSFLSGWRSEEMANYLSVTRPGQIDAEEFLFLVRHPQALDLNRFPFLAAIPPGGTLEGYLFPGRYPIDAETTTADLVAMMLETFDAQVTPAMRQQFGAQGLGLREALIIASIIEREATIDEEKPVMAAVFLNRLRQGMPLQADPTVQYAIGYQSEPETWWKVPLSADDLAVESPYNTYRVDGLPPGPISNPGLASLAAVAQPAAVDFLYFVLDCAGATPGRHLFSHTYDEHVANVQRCR